MFTGLHYVTTRNYNPVNLLKYLSDNRMVFTQFFTCLTQFTYVKNED